MESYYIILYAVIPSHTGSPRQLWEIVGAYFTFR